MVVPIHAPTSGTISAIKQAMIAHPSGLMQLCIFLDVDGEDTWRPRTVCPDLALLSTQQIIKKIAEAGIAGMGGAGFPTHIKASSKPDINFLIINGIECEPYITSDDLIMMEQSEAIVDGIKILDKLLNPAFILIAIEDNKPKAIKVLEDATKHIEKIIVCNVPTKYPAGGEKQLIQVLTGREVASGELPIDSGIVMQNVATCFAINEAVRHDIPLIKRVVTITGQALDKPQNVWALLGTPINFLLEQCGAHEVKHEKRPVIMGGPMMGFTVASELVPIVKTSNCILVPSKKEMPSAYENESNEVECIRCGKCADVCPSQLLPQELQWSAKAKDYPQLKKLNLSDCIDCGACAYVCPSQIPLVHYYRVAKAEIRQQQQLDAKADKAKIRFEARKLRLEKEKIARQEKQQKAAAARKAAMNKPSAEASGAKSAVAAALARVKAKKAAKDNTTPIAELAGNGSASSDVSSEKSQIAAAIARAKAKKQQKIKAAQTPDVASVEVTTGSNQTAQNLNVTTENTTSPAVNDKKSQVAAAIAKAKAKKQANAKLDENNNKTTTDENGKVNKGSVLQAPQTILPNAQQTLKNDEKKQRIAKAIAKAKEKSKTKKQVQPVLTQRLDVDDIETNKTFTNASVYVDSSEPSYSKNGNKKTELTNDTVSNDSIGNEDNSQSNSTKNKTDDKSVRIAAAIAKAKAKKKAKQAQLENKQS
jgi:electron transport complex protein RnfC